MIRPHRCLSCGACLKACPQKAAALGSNGKSHSDKKCIVCGACAEICPSGARELIGREASADILIREIERDLPFFEQSGGGVTFGGGEPLAQPGFLRHLLEGCRKAGIRTAVDTCGNAETEVLLRLAPLIDLFLYDLKIMDGQKHSKHTGRSNSPILENLRRLAPLHSNILIRFPLIPGINDDARNLDQAAKFIASIGLDRLEILPYHSLGEDKASFLNQKRQPRKPVAPTIEQLESVLRSFRDQKITANVGR
jgi:pyruvate formate lyase activating enzyme